MIDRSAINVLVLFVCFLLENSIHDMCLFTTCLQQINDDAFYGITH